MRLLGHSSPGFGTITPFGADADNGLRVTIEPSSAQAIAWTSRWIKLILARSPCLRRAGVSLRQHGGFLWIGCSAGVNPVNGTLRTAPTVHPNRARRSRRRGRSQRRRQQFQRNFFSCRSHHLVRPPAAYLKVNAVTPAGKKIGSEEVPENPSTTHRVPKPGQG